jgi:hypothetical protein
MGSGWGEGGVLNFQVLPLEYQKDGNIVSCCTNQIILRQVEFSQSVTSSVPIRCSLLVNLVRTTAINKGIRKEEREKERKKQRNIAKKKERSHICH